MIAHPVLKKFTFVTLLALITAELFYFYISMLKASVGTLSALLIRDYGMTVPDLSMMVSVFYIVALLLKVPVGVLVDYYGPKYPLIIVILLCALGAFVFSQASSLIAFIGSRSLMAIGYSCALLATVKIFVKYVPRRLYAFLIGTTLFCGYLGSSFAGYPLAKLTGMFHYNHIFIGISIIGVTLAIVLFTSLENDEPSIATEKRTLFAASKQTFLLLKNPQIILLSLFTGILVSGAICIADLWGKLYLVKVFSMNNNSAAFVSTTMIYLGISVGSFVWGIIQSVFRCGRFTLFSIAIITALSSLSFFLMGDASVIVLACLGFILGSLSAAKVICYDLVRSLVGYKNLAAIVGILAMSVTGMGGIIQLFIGFVFYLVKGFFGDANISYNITIITIPVILLIAAVLALFIKVQPLQNDGQSDGSELMDDKRI